MLGKSERHTHREAMAGVSHFAREAKVRRAAPFVLELAPDVKIPVKSYVKTKYVSRVGMMKLLERKEKVRCTAWIWERWIGLR